MSMKRDISKDASNSGFITVIVAIMVAILVIIAVVTIAMGNHPNVDGESAGNMVQSVNASGEGVSETDGHVTDNDRLDVAFEAAKSEGDDDVARAVFGAYRDGYELAGVRMFGFENTYLMIDMDTGMEYIYSNRGVTSRNDEDGSQIQSPEWTAFMREVENKEYKATK